MSATRCTSRSSCKWWLIKKRPMKSKKLHSKPMKKKREPSETLRDRFFPGRFWEGHLDHIVRRDVAGLLDCMSLPKMRRLTLDVATRVTRIGRAEPQTRRASRGSSYRSLCRNRYVKIV